MREQSDGDEMRTEGVSVVLLAVLAVLTLPVTADETVACTVYRQPGDITLGALLSLHGSSSSYCDTPIIPRGVVHTEAFVWAVRDVNSRHDLLPNITLGFDIRDDCRNEDVALWMSLTMLENITPDAFRYACPDSTAPSSNRSTSFSALPDPKVIGIIGTSRSTTSIPVSQLTGLFQVPLMSYWASSNELSNKDRFPYFLRTVPPDKYQISAIVDMIVRFQWNYIVLIHSVDSYGLHGARELIRLAEQENICIAFTSAINQNPTETELSKVVGKLASNPYAKVVVMFAALQVANSVLDHVKSTAPDLGITWIGGDDWGFDLTERGLGEVARGSLFTRFFSQTVPSFETHFLSLDSASPERVSPWYAEYSQCAADDDAECQGVFQDNPSSNYVVSPVADGVYAFAHALDSLLTEVCPERTNCPAFQAITGEALTPHLLKVHIVGTGGLLFFDDYADPPGKYILKNYQRMDNGKYASVEVGLWDSQNTTARLQLRDYQIRWQGGSGEVPRSTCIPDCPPGHVLVPSVKKCCWTCQACLDHEIVVNSSSECVECSYSSWPTADRTRCQSITPSSLSLQDPVVITILLFSVAGILLASLTAAGMFYHRRKPLIKAASRELSSLVLIGMVLAFLSVLLLLVRPSRWTCPASEATISLSLTLTYAPTLLKVNRIYRIFQAGKVSARRPNWVSPRKLVVMAGVLILIQILIIVVSTSVRPVRARLTVPLRPVNHLELYCAFSYEFLPSCAYNLVLVLVCCFYAFKSRRVPDNYNESKFIAVSVYSTLVVFLASLPVYLTAAVVVQKVATLSAAVLLNGYLTLVCVYLPKLYAVRFIPKQQHELRSTTAEAPTAVAAISQAVGGEDYTVPVGRIRPL